MRAAGVAVKWLVVALLLMMLVAIILCLPPLWRQDRLRNIAKEATVVEIDPHAVVIRPELTHGKVSRFESFNEAMTRLKPYAAVNGTFYGSDMKPLGDILIDGKLVNRGIYRCAIGITNKGDVDFIWRKGAKFDWTGYKCGLAAGPRLVHNGKIDAKPIDCGFTRKGLPNTAPRTGIGKTESGQLLLVVVREPVTLRQFAGIMRSRRCVEAMNLDGGPACGLYYKGHTLVSPSLRMTNLLVFYERD